MPARFIPYGSGALALIYGFVSTFVWGNSVLAAFGWLIATISFGFGFVLYELAILARLLARLSSTRKGNNSNDP